jgi:hypothetical protein
MLLANSKTEHGFELQMGAFKLDFFIRQPGQSHLNSERWPSFAQKQASASALIFVGAFHVWLAVA